MLLIKVANELRKVKKIYSIRKMYGEKAERQYNAFLYDTKHSKCCNRKLFAIKQLSKILDVPVAFIIRIMQLERIEEIEQSTSGN